MSLEPVWIEKREVLLIHQLQLAEHGGLSGVRDLALLESALARPKNFLAYSPVRASLPHLAAAYAFGVTSNHPFVDGNKRTALVVSYTFLALNGSEIRTSREEAYFIFLGLAGGSISEEDLATWFADHTSRA